MEEGTVMAVLCMLRPETKADAGAAVIAPATPRLA
jgi:hypothetical protein